jgi:YggT family protein
MLSEIIAFLLDVAVGLIGGACLLRLYMQHQRIGFGNPIGRFVFALSDWIVVPLRKLLRPVGRVDTASAVAAYLLVLVQMAVLYALLSFGLAGLARVPVAALFGVLRLAIMGMFVLVLLYAVLSWFNPDSPVYDLFDRICAPVLRPFRRLIPLVGGVDLSPLALMVVLQIGLILVRRLLAVALGLPFFS